MTKITIQTPVEIDLEDIPDNVLFIAVQQRLFSNINITRAQFLDLADAIIEMRFRDAFDLMEAVAPNLFNADQAHNAQLDRILNKANQENVETTNDERNH